MHTVDHQATFWSPPLGLWGYGASGCARADASCWFLPQSECEEADVLQGCSLSKSNRLECIRLISPKFLRTNAQLSPKDTELGYPSSIPGPYRKRGHFWYIAQLLRRLLRPNERFTAVLARTKRESGWVESLQHPVLSMHIRRGDSCLDAARSRKCQNLKEYMNLAVIPMHVK